MLERETRDTTYWLYGLILVSLVNIGFNYLIADRSINNTDYASLSSLQNGFGLVYAIFLVGSFVFIARWVYRAAKANRDAGREGLRYSPVSSVAWFFVPVMSAWKPYFAVKEIYLTRLQCSDFPSINARTTFHLWWFSLLVSSVLAAFFGAGQSPIVGYSATNISGDTLVLASLFSITSDIAQILSSLALIKIMRQFTAGKE